MTRKSATRRSSRVVVFAVSLVAAGGCAEWYAYTPTEMVSAQTEGYPTARYPVPAEAPKGSVYVTSFGIVDMDVAPGTKAPLLNVRMSVANDNGGAVWQIDTRQQIVDLGPEGRSRAAYVNTDVQGSPLVPIPPGTKRIIDFYYSLPAGMQKASHVPHFDFLWRLDVPNRPVAQRTPFDRVRIDDAYAYGGPYPPYVAVGLGWAPFWWYDPFYPTLTFYHPFVLHQHYPGIVHPGYVGPRVYGPTMRGAPVGAPHAGPALRGSPPHH